MMPASQLEPEWRRTGYLANFNVVAAEKWPGSVEDGISWLRAHEQIVIHPRCKRTEEEFRLYRYKTDPVTSDVLPIIIDKHNHCVDALRYSLEPAIRIPEREIIYEYNALEALDREDVGGGW